MALTQGQKKEKEEEPVQCAKQRRKGSRENDEIMHETTKLFALLLLMQIKGEDRREREKDET